MCLRPRFERQDWRSMSETIQLVNPKAIVPDVLSGDIPWTKGSLVSAGHFAKLGFKSNMALS